MGRISGSNKGHKTTGHVHEKVSLCCLVLLLACPAKLLAQMTDIPIGVTPVSLNVSTTVVSAPGNSTKLEICSTDACVTLASQYLAAMNFSVDPCDDFYAFSCDNYIATHRPNKNLDEASVFSDLEAQVRAQIDSMLQLTYYDYNADDAEVKVKQAYKQCLDNRLVGSFDPSPLLTFINTIIPGGWPMLNPNWDPSRFDLYAVLLNAAVYGVKPLFTFEVSPSFLNVARNILVIGQPATFATKDTLASDIGPSITSSYVQQVVDATQLILQQAGIDRTATDVLNDALGVVDLETDLALAGLTEVQRRDLSIFSNETTLGAFQDATLTRSNYFRRLTGFIKDVFAIANVTQIDRSAPVIAATAEVFAALDEIVASLEVLGGGGKRRMANYIGWKLIAANVVYLTKDMQQVHERYLQRIGILRQAPQNSPTEAAKRTCIQTMRSIMPLSLELLYVKNFVPPDLKPKVSMLATDIKLGFAELLRAATWMDNATTSLALRKLDEMLNFVAYSDAVVNNRSAVDLEYSQIKIGPTFFDTMQTVDRYMTLKDLQSVDRTNARSDPFNDPTDITESNASNDFAQNVIDIYAGILAKPFYDPQVPQYLNYGSIGFSVGHEITHGFDDQGALFDPDRALRVWWTNATTQAFDQRKQGFVDQYSKFCVPEGCVNGQLTLGENIADNGGIKAAYKGYFEFFRQRVSGNPEVGLPGFVDFSPEQMFFLSTGHTWCGSYRTDAQQLRLLDNVHSPLKFRVNGPLSNMPEFSRAFNCPLGSNMNPAQKFSVW